ncbi:MAG: zinc-dependent metalloprotease [Actinomyces sp.]|uniref:zinc-dependent metalloprotease n=1 Tax=Actinomyces sp. TaxID=29317 RepID=UPI0026DCFA28|nr:zinc-dependent metalloprotease [Actinomyces sp.]MDO4244130.1 zinc-dependent metalloprotease [Actinomyces sp.]
MTATSTAADLVPWETAVRLAAATTPAGPVVPRGARRAVVALLRRSVDDALPWAGAVTGMRAAAGRAAAACEVLVVDRPGLMAAQVASLRGVLGGVAAPPPGAAARALAAAQVAGALGLVSTRLLGQVLPAVDGVGPTRLLLVAPNVLAIQRRLELDLLDLPAWVTLHEATHLIQLEGAPWLAGHLTDSMREVVAGLVDTVGGGREDLPGVGTRLGRAARLLRAEQGARGLGVPDGAVLLDEMLQPPERSRLAHLATVLALMEGHAEAVLDTVEPTRMPSVHRLRAVLARTRGNEGGVGPGPGVGGMLNRVIGLEAKEAQYADGAAFVRAVVARVGHEGFNVVWRGPDYLPLPSEIARPDQWIGRLGLS